MSYLEEAKKYFNEGMEYVEKSDFDNAIESFTKTIECFEKEIALNTTNATDIKNNPYYAGVYNNRGNAYNSKEEYDKAINDYNKIIAINPNDVMAYYNKGITYNNKKEYGKAIINYTKAIKINTNYAKAYNNRGGCYYDKEEYDKAIIDFDKTIKLNPNDASAYYNRGIVYDAKEKHVEAINDYAETIKLNPNYAKPYQSIGLIYIYQKRYNDAFDYLATSLALENKSITIYFLISNFIKEISLDKIFDLIKINYIVWINDETYQYIIKEYRNNSENTRKLWFYQYVLLYILSLKNTDKNIDISHYLKLDILKELLAFNNKEETKEKKLRLTSLTEANDMEEGNILLKILEKKEVDIPHNRKDTNTIEKLVVLQSSFSRNKDSLTMFRLYGKNEDKEATGANLIFKKSFFNIDNLSQIGAELSSAKPTNRLSNANFLQSDIQLSDNIPTADIPFDNKTVEVPKKLPLYYILYYDKERNDLIYNPTSSKYNYIVIPLENDTSIDNWELMADNDNENEKKIIKNIQIVFTEIIKLSKDIINSNNSNIENHKLVDLLLINLHYLIKDVAFIEEAELRLLKIISYDNYKNIGYGLDGSRPYIDYLPIIEGETCHIKEIILGSKAEHVDCLVESLNIHLCKKGYSDIKISVSKAPLR